MDQEVAQVIAFLFKRSGKENISFSEFYLTLSMDLNWFTPEDAKKFTNLAIKQKLLTKKGDLVTPNFEFEKINVPIGFYPSKKVFEGKKEEKIEDFLTKIIQLIEEKSNLNKNEILERIKILEKEKNITTESAALLIGKNYEIVLDDFIREIEEKMI